MSAPRTSPGRSPSSSPTPVVLLGVLAAMLAGVIGADAWKTVLVALVSGGEAGVGVLAGAACLWLLWRGRAALQPGHGGSAAALFASGAVALLWVGVLGDWLFVEHAGTVLLAPALFAQVLRGGALPVVVAASGALLFALPVPGLVVEHVAVPLQFAEARAVELLALLLDFDVARDGIVVFLDGTPVRVDEGCSGFVLLWPALLACWTALCSLELSWGGRGLAARALLCAFAVPLALAANFLRLFATVLAHAHLDAESAGLLHDVLGWALVVAIGAAPFLLAAPDDEGRAPAAELDAPPAPHAFAWRAGGFAAALACAVAALGVGEASGARSELAAGHLDRQLQALPWRFGGLVGARRSLPEREQELLGADAVVHRAYVDLDSGEEVLFVAAWHRDAARAEGHTAEKCYRVRGWELERADALTASRVGEHTRRYVFARPGRHITVFELVLDGPVPRAFADAEAHAGRLRVLIVLDGVRDGAPALATVASFVTALDLVATGGIV